MKSFLTGWLMVGVLLVIGASERSFASDVYHQRSTSFYTYGAPNSNYVGSPYTALSTSPQLAPLYFQGGANVARYSSGYGGYVYPDMAPMPVPMYGSGFVGGVNVGLGGFSTGQAPLIRGYSPAFQSPGFAVPRGSAGFRRR